MKIPAHTLYVVLCYAWERFENLDPAAARDRASVPDDLPQNLLARLLRDSFRRLWRRGLDRGYLERAEDTRRPKGKIDMAGTVARALRSSARVAVRYEELTRNVLPNCLVKSTMLRLASLPVNDLDHGLRYDLLRLARLLPDVDEVELRGEFFHDVQLHRNNSDYVRLTWARAGRSSAATFTTSPMTWPELPAQARQPLEAGVRLTEFRSALDPWRPASDRSLTHPFSGRRDVGEPLHGRVERVDAFQQVAVGRRGP